jgi:hypothetical protein
MGTHLQEELPLLCVDLPGRLQDARAHLQRQQQLVLLKQPARGVLVHCVCVVVVEGLDPVRKCLRLRAVSQAEVEEGVVGVKAELVHGIRGCGAHARWVHRSSSGVM